MNILLISLFLSLISINSFAQGFCRSQSFSHVFHVTANDIYTDMQVQQFNIMTAYRDLSPRLDIVDSKYSVIRPGEKQNPEETWKHKISVTIYKNKKEKEEGINGKLLSTYELIFDVDCNLLSLKKLLN